VVAADSLALRLDPATLRSLGAAPDAGAQVLTVAYAYGPFTNVQTLRSDDPATAAAAGAARGRGAAGQRDRRAFRRLHLNPFPIRPQQAGAAGDRKRPPRRPAAARARLAGGAGDRVFVASFAVGRACACGWPCRN
jgi:SP family myo-inositol transporter-like MFS transporter 13